MPLPTPLVGAPPYGKVVEWIAEGLFTEGPSGGVETIKTANVFHYRWNGAGLFVTPTKGQLDTAIYNVMGILMIAALNVHWTFVRTRTRFLDDASDQYADVAVNLPGNTANDCLPPRNAAYVELTTGLRGRNWVGSKHYGPIAEADTTSTEINTPTPAWWTNLKNGHLTAVVAGGMTYNLHVVSSTLSQVKTNPTSIMSAQVTVATLRRNLGGMKRRRPKSSAAA